MGIPILFIAIVIAIIVVAVIAVYYNHYTRIINQRLKEQVSDGKKVWSPATVAIITAFFGLVLFSITVLLVRINSPTSSIDDRYFQAQYDYEAYAPEYIQQGYLSGFSIAENAGYTKHEETTGDIKYTYFISNERYDIFHPAFIIFVEYIGTGDIISYGIQGAFLTDTSETICGKGFSGADVSDYVCIIGNTSVDCIFQISLYYYDEDGGIALLQDETIMNSNSESYSTAFGAINIEINRPQE